MPHVRERVGERILTTSHTANPELRNLFHRIVRLSKAGALALFVFDGPHRPPVKRGNRIWRGEHRLEADTIKLIEAFGYEWRLVRGLWTPLFIPPTRKGVKLTRISATRVGSRRSRGRARNAQSTQRD